MRERVDITDAGALMPKYRYRVETVKAGDVAAVSIYPIWDNGVKIEPAEKKNRTSEAQKRENAKRAERRFFELVNTNFSSGDIFATFTHLGELPSPEEAREHVRRAISRIKYHYMSEGMREEDFKYIYVCEFREETDEKRGRKKTRLHHHVFFKGLGKALSSKKQKKGLFTDRDLIESLWKHGSVETRYLKSGVYGPGLKNISDYLMKDPHGKKRWGRSRNLQEPKITYSDSRVTPRKAFKMATDYEYLVSQLEKWNPGRKVRLVDDVTFNSMNGAAYIYAILEREEKDDGKKLCKRE
ncbi:MAG: hypothetical protein IJD14_04830 [Christensenellaceae bacterium]|nr:hypothetical protein [Christensenellaceae bacterium]